MIYQITSGAGVDLGTYDSTSREEALDAMAREAGYADHATACRESGDDGAHLVVSERGDDHEHLHPGAGVDLEIALLAELRGLDAQRALVASQLAELRAKARAVVASSGWIEVRSLRRAVVASSGWIEVRSLRRAGRFLCR